MILRGMELLPTTSMLASCIGVVIVEISKTSCKEPAVCGTWEGNIGVSHGKPKVFTMWALLWNICSQPSRSSIHWGWLDVHIYIYTYTYIYIYIICMSHCIPPQPHSWVGLESTMIPRHRCFRHFALGITAQVDGCWCRWVSACRRKPRCSCWSWSAKQVATIAARNTTFFVGKQGLLSFMKETYMLVIVVMNRILYSSSIVLEW